MSIGFQINRSFMLSKCCYKHICIHVLNEWGDRCCTVMISAHLVRLLHSIIQYVAHTNTNATCTFIVCVISNVHSTAPTRRKSADTRSVSYDDIRSCMRDVMTPYLKQSVCVCTANLNGSDSDVIATACLYSSAEKSYIDKIVGSTRE